jgi:hypothetical protein
LSSQSGAVTGFSILSQDTDEIIMSRASAPAPVGQSEYVFSNMQNPTGFPGAFYVQIFTYPTADATGVANFMSSVANATAEPILITTEVPPILFFCAAVTVDMWCQNTGSQIIDLGNLSTLVENAGTSQFGVATNADNGYTVTINGTTLTSGNKVIDVMSVPAANAPGTAQFGLNIRANTNPALGQDITGLGIGTVTANYDTPDQFLYQNGDIVATAVTGTLFDIFTVTYIVNVPPDQPSGVYNTTIAYICTASF